MSRYTKIIKGNKGQDIRVSWGTDHALGYWYDIWDEL